MPNNRKPFAGGHLQKSDAETYGRDESRFTDYVEGVPDELDTDSPLTAAYNASCEAKHINQHTDALAGGRERKNIHDIAGDTSRTKSTSEYYKTEDTKPRNG